MVALTSKLELLGFLWRSFNSQRLCVANSVVMTPCNTAKDTGFKSFRICTPYAYEYVCEGGEGEEYNNFH